MAYMSVTNIGNTTTKVKAFTYLIKPNSLSIATWGAILQGTEGSPNKSTLTNTTIDTLCRGQGGGDLANITNLASNCGLLYGAPIRKDDSNSSLSDPGSAWTMPMYSCMSIAKATIKIVSFRFIGTTDDLAGLEVVSLIDKIYDNKDSMPLWGVENTSMFLRDGGPLWGLISPSRQKDLNLSIVQKESLYLPGRKRRRVFGTRGLGNRYLRWVRRGGRRAWVMLC
ncbi:hypothetical protein EK21DRAFT_118925 [Setomelanomma holmii]|uniref:Uncharacterized protein n=1 Tax=Setomelanomma holmii TaxID=210430 RepID=A0A9P4GWI5_9PLEO|nr:hypothetical protein EK21DRAFT_118925 [Setomelanomma holmii]